MATRVLSHIDQFGRLSNPGEGGLTYGFRRGDKGHHAAIMVRIQGIIQYFYPRYRCNRRHNLGHNFRAAALAEVGNTFDNFLHRPLLITRQRNRKCGVVLGKNIEHENTREFDRTGVQQRA